MAEAAENLPDDIEALKDLVLSKDRVLQDKDRTLQEKNDLLHDKEQQIALLREELRLALYRRFAPKSEKACADQLTLLFDEAEVEAARADTDEEVQETTIPAHKRNKPGRKKLPDHLPRTRIEHDLTEEQKRCACGCMKTRIGEETCEQLDIIPAKIQVLQHVRFKYACRSCEGVEDEGPSVQTAPMPKQPIPKSNASPGLLAYIVTSKFQDGLPLYRLERMFPRIGVELSRGTMANWMIKVGELITPLMDLLNETQLGYDILQMDETTVQVLKEEGRAATSKSYMWVRRGGPPGRPVVLFDYDPSRGGQVPVRLLETYKGFLQTDDYKGYNTVAARDDIVHVACLAHARRKFHEALQAQGKARKSKSKSGRGGLASQGMDLIGRIYAVERRARKDNLAPDDRMQLRLEKAKPIWDELRQWLDRSIHQVPPGVKTGRALNYLDRQWPKLIRVLEDGRLEVDNNFCENSIRPFVLGRKNWLFSDTAKGAKASANLYSLIETAKAGTLEPNAWLQHVFTHLPNTNNASDIEALLPWNVAL